MFGRYCERVRVWGGLGRGKGELYLLIFSFALVLRYVKCDHFSSQGFHPFVYFSLFVCNFSVFFSDSFFVICMPPTYIFLFCMLTNVRCSLSTNDCRHLRVNC
uniref:Uncharacterized protein n=1 Tax=Cacopsylla melanoneura TaxID=428564 RepID=A0A8D9E591_9HEMI